MQLCSFLSVMILMGTMVIKLSPDAYYRELEKCHNAVLLDVRVFDDFSASRIPNAQWAGNKKVLDSLLTGLSHETPLFIYCTKGDRTKQVASILKKKKFRKIYDLEGGFEKWMEQGFPVDDVIWSAPEP